jgi:hypothetical protein
MEIKSSKDCKVFFIDDNKVMIEGRLFIDKSSHNLPTFDECFKEISKMYNSMEGHQSLLSHFYKTIKKMGNFSQGA